MHILWQVTAPHFCAGLITTGNLCTEAAPILHWAIGKTRAFLRNYFARKQWTIKYISTEAPCTK